MPQPWPKLSRDVPYNIQDVPIATQPCVPSRIAPRTQNTAFGDYRLVDILDRA